MTLEEMYGGAQQSTAESGDAVLEALKRLQTTKNSGWDNFRNIAGRGLAARGTPGGILLGALLGMKPGHREQALDDVTTREAAYNANKDRLKTFGGELSDQYRREGETGQQSERAMDEVTRGTPQDIVQQMFPHAIKRPTGQLNVMGLGGGQTNDVDATMPTLAKAFAPVGMKIPARMQQPSHETIHDPRGGVYDVERVAGGKPTLSTLREPMPLQQGRGNATVQAAKITALKDELKERLSQQAIEIAASKKNAGLKPTDAKRIAGLGTSPENDKRIGELQKMIEGAGGGQDDVPEFATEDEAAAAGLQPGTRIKIGGQTGTWH
jgi:hypothetical protein